jgi:hypothetical protein
VLASATENTVGLFDYKLVMISQIQTPKSHRLSHGLKPHVPVPMATNWT